MNVLVVDDEPGMRETLVAIFEQSGFDAEAAADGEEALARVTARAFDVVVMDVRMPGMDGVDVLHAIGPSGPTVILMTAYASDDRLARGVQDAFAVVNKPFSAQHLLSLVAQAKAS